MVETDLPSYQQEVNLNPPTNFCYGYVEINGDCLILSDRKNFISANGVTIESSNNLSIRFEGKVIENNCNRGLSL